MDTFVEDTYLHKILRDEGVVPRLYRRLTKRGIDLSQLTQLIVPFHVPGHFVLAEAKLQDREIVQYDSLHGRLRRRDLKLIRNFVHQLTSANDLNTWKIKSAPHDRLPKQMNGDDCGIFVALFARYLAEGKNLSFSQDDMSYWRRRIGYELLNNSEWAKVQDLP